MRPLLIMRLSLLITPLLLAACSTEPGVDAGRTIDGAAIDDDLVMAGNDLAGGTCANGALDGAETDVDCGGSCAACAIGKHCMADPDCGAALCVAGTCVASRCMDGVLDGVETDLDCGGGTCLRCDTGKVCRVHDDCMSGVCQAGRCIVHRQTTLSFAPVAEIPLTAYYSYAIAGADFTGDQRVDLAVHLNGTDEVVLFVGRGDGTFLDPQGTPAGLGNGNAPTELATGDFNKDGKADLVIAVSRKVVVLAGAANGFAGPVVVSTANTSISAATGDFDGDGRLDIAAGGVALFGRGNLAFDPEVKTPEANEWMLAADIDGDRHPDLLSYNTGMVAATRSLANRGFQSSWQQMAMNGLSYHGLGVGSLSPGGQIDLVVQVSLIQGSMIQLFYGDGKGQFQPGQSYPGVMPMFQANNWFAVADLDGDGLNDVAAADLLGAIGVHLGVVGGGLLPVKSFAVGTPLHGIVAADFNRDGKIDLATVVNPKNMNSVVQVLINTSK